MANTTVAATTTDYISTTIYTSNAAGLFSECSDDIGGVDINRLSIGFSIGYGVFMMLIFISISIKGYRDVKLGKDKHQQKDYDVDIDAADYQGSSDKITKTESIIQNIKKKGCFHYFKRWAMYVWAIRSMYAAAAVHIYDISTDIGVILEWWLLAYQQQEVDNWPLVEVYKELNMTVLFIAALVALNVYRIISSILLYKYTKKCSRFFSQFFDLEIFRIIYINHKLNRTEPGNLHRFLSKIEAIFESSPQSVLQVVFLVKTIDIGVASIGNCEYDAFSPLVFASLLFSIISVAGRFIADDKVFFDKQRAQNLGFGFKGNSWALTWNNGFIVRYLWRLSDVIARVMILSFIWIVFGGEICGLIFGAEAVVILLVIMCSNEEVGQDFLQFLFTTYIVGKNFKNGFWNLNKVMKWSLLFRMFENVIQLAAVTYFLFNRDLLTDCITCPPSSYIKKIIFEQAFGMGCFIIAWITCILYIVLFIAIMKMKLWRDLLVINKDRDISKVAYGITKEKWKEGTFNINADRDIIKTALRGDILTVKEMLAFGYDINGVDKDGRNLLHHCCFNQQTDKDTLDYIMIDCNCKSIVNKPGTKLGQYPIHYYIWANSDLKRNGPGQISHFVKVYEADPQVKDKDNNTLLHFASRNRNAFNNLEMVEFLRREYKMDMNRKNDLDQCPFHFYLKWNKHAKLLYFSQFKKKYKLDFTIIDKKGFTILHWAVSNWKGKCKANIVEFVLNNGGYEYINNKTNDGQTVEDVLNALDDDMEVNTKKDKETEIEKKVRIAQQDARNQWLEQRDLILELLTDFRSGKRKPVANVDETVEKCLVEEAANILQQEAERIRKEEEKRKKTGLKVKIDGDQKIEEENKEEENKEEKDDGNEQLVGGDKETVKSGNTEQQTGTMVELGTQAPTHIVKTSDDQNGD